MRTPRPRTLPRGPWAPLRGVISALLLVFGLGCSGGGRVRLEPATTLLLDTPASIPAEEINGWLIVPAWIDGEGPFRLLLDTGSSGVFLKPEPAGRLWGHRTPNAVRSRDASGHSRWLDVIRVDELRLSSAIFEGLDVVVSDLEHFPEIDGLLGMAVFKRCVITIDFPRASIQLTREHLRSDDPDSLPLMAFYGTPFIYIDYGSTFLETLIDTGSRDFISINELDAKLCEFQRPPRPLWKAIASTRSYRQKAARLAHPVTLGRWKIDSPIVAIDPSPTLLGVKLLKHFTLTIDWVSELIRLSRADDEPITTPSVRLAGFVFETEGDALIVIDLVPDSPAAESDLRLGDRILEIEGLKATELETGFLLNLLKDHTKLRLRVESSGKSRDLTIPIEVLVP